MDNPKKDALYIPLGLKAESEIFSGFGKTELMQSLLVTAGAGLVDIVLYFILRSVEISLVFLLVSAAGAIGVFIKDATGNSMAIQLGGMARFMRSQKKYRYVQMDEWEGIDRI